MFASSWFLTLFSNFNTISPLLALRVWDCVLADGWTAVFGVALAVLAGLQVSGGAPLLHLLHCAAKILVW